MSLRRVLALSLTILLAAATTPPARTVDGGRMGPLRLFPAEGQPSAFVYVVSDEAGWNADLDAAAAGLAARGAIVAGIDLPSYRRGLAASDERDCHYLVSDLEEYSHRFQRELGVSAYRLPIVAGVGAGATMAYAALAQAPAATLSGAASLDMRPALKTPLALCEGAPATPAEGGGFAYGPAAGLPGWCRVAVTAPPPAGSADLAARVPGAERVTLPPGSGAADALVALVAPKLAAAAAGAGPTADLPLATIPAAAGTARTPLMAIIISGDGGWRDLDKTIGQWLSQQGVPVVGLDSLLFFWRRKTPEAVARAVERIVDDYGARWQAQKVVLVGYSFGADVLPATYNRLRPDIRARVVELSLLGFSRRASFQIEVTGWLGFQPGAEAPSTVAEAKRIDPALIQCIYGAEEDDTACLDPALAGVEHVKTAGGHHFDGDYPRLAGMILDGALRRAAAR